MRIKVSASAWLSLAVLFWNEPRQALAICLAILIHELGHIVSARLLGIRFRELSLSSLGAGLCPQGDLGSYTDEIIVSAAGPFVNLICFLLLHPLLEPIKIFGITFLSASLFFALLNLLPIDGFDGGRILICLFLKKDKLRIGQIILRIATFFCLFCLWSFSLYLLLRTSDSLALFLFSCSLFCRLFLS